MAQSVFIRHRKERSVYQLCWKEQGRERTKSFNTRQEAEKEKRRRLELIAEGFARSELFDLLSPHEKRELFAIHERAKELHYNPWDAMRTHEQFLETRKTPGIEIGKAVKRCLGDKEAEGVSAAQSGPPPGLSRSSPSS